MNTRIFAIAIAGLIIATVHAAATLVTVNLQDAKAQRVDTAILIEEVRGVS
jgi:hypothetical protein